MLRVPNSNISFSIFIVVIFIFSLTSCEDGREQSLQTPKNIRPIQAMNEPTLAPGKGIKVIKGATLIDGNGGEPIENAVVIIKDNIIENVLSEASVKLPEGAEVIDADGLYLLPGLIDAHYHGDNPQISVQFLQHGVTSARNPGAWIEDYEDVLTCGQPIPRLFLTGPHLDMFPPAYPANSALVRDKTEARNHVQFFYEQGASAIKVYFRLTPDLIKEVCQTADKLGIL
ncbi:MAG: hypothetical protein ACFHWX_02620 [Bacteroidota bacterium]